VTEEALLLTRGALQLADRNISKLLGFFGVPWSAQTLAEFTGDNRSSPEPSKERRVFGSAAAFLDVVSELERWPELMRRWQESVHSAFVYGGDRIVLQKLLGALGHDEVVIVNTLWRGPRNFAIRENSELCGPMAGTRIPVSSGIGPSHAFHRLNSNVQKIISAENTAVFIQLDYHGVAVFISTAMEIVDLDAELARGIFDIREHLFTALPLVFYVKWAFALSSWRPREANACVVIDDPLLKPRHGFVDFQELLSLMKRHNFCTNIAFIPWNWRRTDPETARLFRENRKYYSVSVHGCDHNRAEFGSNDLQLLSVKSQQALRRMASHRRETGIDHEPVMVFPHGALSEAALLALRHTEFIAAAGNESISKDVVPRPIRVSDVWDIAVTCYSSFPIFTRRSPHEGIANVAFDLLLGKPALISIHHDFCRDNYKHLIAFIDSVNALKTRLNWCSLGEAMKGSYRQRETSRGIVEIEMSARDIYIENSSDYPKRFIVSKREFDPTAIRVVRTELDRLSWNFSDDRVQFEIDLDPGQKTTIHLDFHELSGFARREKSVPYQVRTMLRRYACELRDNYVVTEKVPVPARLRDVFQSDSESIVSASHPQANGDSRLTAANRNSRDATYTVSAEKMPGVLPDRASEAITNFTEWLQRYGETSWDHQSFFAGAVGRQAKSLYYRRELVGTLAVAPMVFFEAFIPGARCLFHHRIRLPIADAHYAMGFAFLYEATQERRHFERAIHFLKELERSRCPNFEEYCWGYPFDWVTRGGTIKREVPLITTTPYVYEAFLQMFQLEPRREWKEVIASIARHAACDIKSFKTSEQASSSSYTPFDTGGVINAAAYRAFLLTSASQFLSNTDYLGIAERNLNFVLETQNPDGSWFYAVDHVRDFVDHFHTCFVLKALAKIYRLTRDERIDVALEKGVQYYVCNLFDEDGLPKPFSRAPRLTVYKRELYDCAECINVCLLLRSRFPDLENILTNVIASILGEWVKSDGSFRSRQLHFGWDNVPMHRWGQSQMFRSLAYYLREAREEMKGDLDRADVWAESATIINPQPSPLNI
jgi:hypothetical protein